MGGPDEVDQARPSKRARIGDLSASASDISIETADISVRDPSLSKPLAFIDLNMGPQLAAKKETPKPPPASEFLGPRGIIRRTEYVRLITQALRGLGYASTAARLEEESSIPLQSDAVNRLQDGVLVGRWEECVTLLRELRLDNQDVYKNAKFLILQQKFLEALEEGSTGLALKVLRNELAPLKVNTPQLHRLAAWVMCTNSADLLAQSHWSPGESRYKLLLDLQRLLPPSVLIPEKRLEVLVEQALAHQQAACEFHNTQDEAFCLFADHKCGRDQIPTETVQVLEAHTDEVWYLQFSHDGKKLASASKDNTVIIWEVRAANDVQVLHILQGHAKPLSFVAWSPDDSLILTCGNDNKIKLWDTLSGKLRRTYDKHADPVTACAWFPDGRRFVSGGVDKCTFMWDIDGNELEQWAGARINDLAISSDGAQMISICSEKKIRIYRFADRSEQTIDEVESITSLCISGDSRYLLVNLSSQVIHLWDLGASRLPQKPAIRYKGQKQGRYVIRSCFGGSAQKFIVSGSEDSQVYIWHRGTGDLLEVLPGHSGTVNAVSWNPTNPHMFASASDDHTIRIWGLRKDKQAEETETEGRGHAVANGVKSANGSAH
eukprot:TRINITY_DN15944_c0_g1_i1.p1 TRINITY_DN15944_c0_g1~~TRINITY_DN15944_c0_g1_i1.p1  ORF type:complete len:606 (-),score=172.76 TRINITY_DN15944_c0_g1_i1:173-1990(-)